ncbi:MAG: DNA polymerase I [Thermoanaerobaculia bacterium]|nr:DNA polymerase I [Thermoanaerobaculia bacterium]
MAEPPASPLPTLALLDASNYLYRAFYAIRGLTGPGGRPTNAVYGFLNMWRKYRETRKPEAVAVCFDRYEKTFREEMDASYKAQRQAMPDDLVPQIEDAKRVCRLLGLAVVEEAGYEADDLIGSIATAASGAGMRVEIASADKDLFQLVKDPAVVVWHPVQERLLDEAGVAEFFGVPPSRVIDVLALMGDTSDNIPGVRGIGEKTAKELVTTFGSLDDIYARLEEVKGKRRETLANGREDALLSRTLATVRCDRPLPAAPENLLEHFRIRPLTDEAAAALAAFYEELGFAKLRKELLESRPGGPAKGAPAEPLASRAPSTLSLFDEDAAPAGAPDSARWEASAPGFAALDAAARKAGRAAVHVESGPGAPWPAPPLAAVVAVPGGETVAFALDSSLDGAGIRALAALFRDVPLVAHDAKRLFLAADALGIAPPARVLDSMLASYVVSPGLHAHDLAGDARGILNLPPEALPPLKDLTGGEPVTLDLLASEAGRKWLLPRARLPLALLDALAPRLHEGSALRSVLDDIELPLIPVLARMEIAGVAVDRGVLAEMSKEFDGRLAALEAKIVEEAGEPFNIGSPAQLGRILFEKLAYPAVKKTAKTKSWATDSDVLEELAALSTGPVPGLVLEWREISKLKGTYVDALPLAIAADGRIHTRYDQAVAATGRLSSNAPNLQNIPVRTEAGRAIRRAFVAPPGRVLVAADYSQIELRLLAHLSGDEALLETFRRGEDIHRATAAKIFGVSPSAVTPDQRRGAKTINFGVLYGMGPFALATQLGVPRAEAKEFIAAYFDRFPKIRACLDAILEKARRAGGTETIFGRVRPIPGLHDRNHNVRANAERMAMNAPFQGAAADLIKIAMLRLDAALTREIPEARLLLQVHDELVLECPEPLAGKTASLAKATMEGAATLSVPLTVDVGQGRNWAQAK